MSTNDIELTFIRCPSCKSLMPSSAVTCGMCGFELGASEGKTKSSSSTSESVEGTKKARLRQRTYSGSINELLESAENGDNDKKSGETNDSDTSLSFNETHQAESMKFEDEQHPKPSEDVPDDKSQKEVRRLRFASDSESSKGNDKSSDDFSDQRTTDEDNKSVSYSSQDDNEEDRPKKKKRRRRKKKRVSELNKEPENEVQPEHERKSDKPDQSPSQSVSEENASEEPSSGVSKVNDFNKKHSSGDLTPDNEDSGKLTEKEDQQNYKKHAKPSSIGANKMPDQNQEAILVGWFVNYSTNKTGIYFEIRIGRQFVGRQSLREDDLIIQDSAVSTPHCLLQVNSSESVLLQDLMSEQGTFIQKKGNSDFEQVDSTIKLEHGDKIKLGSYELVVCLVPR